MEISVVSSLPDHTFNPVPRKHGANHQLRGILAGFVGLPIEFYIYRYHHPHHAMYQDILLSEADVPSLIYEPAVC